MEIQSLSSSAFASVTAQRPQSIAPEVSGLSIQTANIPSQNKKAIDVSVSTTVQGDSISREQLNSAVQATKDFVGTINSSLEFSVDEDTGTSVVKIIDKETKELIRQIPSEEMLSIAKALDTIKGLLFRQKA